MTESLDRVYSEVYAVVTAIDEQYRKRIPQDIWEGIVANKNPSYIPAIDPDKALEEQPISTDAFACIAWFKRDFWCDSEEEKAAYIAKLEQNQAELDKNISQTRKIRKKLGIIRDE